MSDPRDDGGPAFPCELRHTESRDGKWVDRWIPEGGMSLRDYFAAKAMQSVAEMWSQETALNNGLSRGVTPEVAVAQCAYEMADAMLKARR